MFQLISSSSKRIKLLCDILNIQHQASRNIFKFLRLVQSALKIVGLVNYVPVQFCLDFSAKTVTAISKEIISSSYCSTAFKNSR